jgi:hypothetical protein
MPTHKNINYDIDGHIIYEHHIGFRDHSELFKLSWDNGKRIGSSFKDETGEFVFQFEDDFKEGHWSGYVLKQISEVIDILNYKDHPAAPINPDDKYEY